MIDGPDISIIASLIGNPGCADVLLSLVAGPALPPERRAAERPTHRGRPL
jgi:hypothetical protein